MRRRYFLAKVGGGMALPLFFSPRLHALPPCVPPSIELAGEETARSNCASGAGPGWYSALGHKQWATPVSNWLGATGVIDPLANSTNAGLTGHESIITAWTGMGADETRKTIFMLRNGGHNDYYGNEVYACDLGQASPAWVRRRNASAAGGSGNQSTWGDGRPTADHTEGSTVAGGGRWFSIGSNAMNYGGGTDVTRWWEFDPDANDYINLGNHYTSAQGAVGFPSGLALFDPIDEQIIQVRTWNAEPSLIFQSLSAMSSGTAAVVNNNPIGTTSYFVGAVDTTNRVLLIRTSDIGYRFVRMNSAAAKQAAFGSVSVSGTAPTLRCTFHWHPPSNAFLTWDGGQSIKKLTPTVSNGNYVGATWSSVSTGFSGVTPPSTLPSTGMYNKIQLMDMGDGTYALIVVPRYANPDVFVCRLTGAV